MNIQIGNFFNKELFSHFVQLLGENFIKTFQNIFSTIPTYVFFIGGGIIKVSKFISNT